MDENNRYAEMGGVNPHEMACGQAEQQAFAPQPQAPPQQAPPQQAPQQQKPAKPSRKKKKFGCLGVFCIFLALIVLAVGFVWIRHNIDKNRAEEYAAQFVYDVKRSSEDLLLLDVQSGAISPDEFIQQMTLSVFAPGRMEEKYRAETEISAAPDLEQYLEQYGEQLSAETLEMVAYYVYLLEYTFDPAVIQTSEASAEAALVQSLRGTANPSAYTVQNLSTRPAGQPAGQNAYSIYTLPNMTSKPLSDYVLSDSGRFLVWYDTQGERATTHEDAKKIARQMDDCSARLEEFLGMEWQYRPSDKAIFLIPGVSPDEMIKMQNAFPVYMLDTSGDNALASYINMENWRGRLIQLLSVFASEDELNGMSIVYSWPYFLVGPETAAHPDAETIVAHELVHHFQYLNGTPHAKTLFSAETVANVFAGEVIDASRNSHFLYNHREAYFADGTGLSPDHDELNAGYASFTWAKSYGDVVTNGWQHLLDSSSEGDPLAFLQQQAGGEYPGVMMDLARRNLTRDYAQQVYSSYQKLPPPRASLGKSGIHKDSIQDSALHYFYFDVQLAQKEKQRLQWQTDAQEMGYCLLGIRSSSMYYELIEERFVAQGELVELELGSDDYKVYSKLALVLVNYGVGEGANAGYTLSLIPEQFEEIVEDDGAFFNGEYYEFYFSQFFDAVFSIIDLTEQIDTQGAAAGEYEQQRGDMAEIRDEVLASGYKRVRIHVIPLSGNVPAEVTHSEVRKTVSMVRLQVLNREDENGWMSAGVGYNPMRTGYAEFYVIYTQPDDSGWFYFITVE